MKCRHLFIAWGVALCGLFASQITVLAQGTLFTYQGQLLLNSSVANGQFDMQFKLHPTPTTTNQVGATLTNAPVGVTNGLFTVPLDFGNVFTTSPLYLEIGVRTNGSTAAYTILSPVQLISSAPYAVQALNSTFFSGGVVDTQLSANVPLLNGTDVFTGTDSFANASGTFSGTFSGATSGTFSGAASGTFSGTGTGTFSGNGANLTNLNVTNLIGVVQSNPNWQLIQASTQQAVAANNYLSTNAAQTTLILPANGNVSTGTTLQISGSGAGGWIITQNAGQSIVTQTMGLPAGQNWSPQATSQPWHALAVSANGLKMAAANGGSGPIFYSNDGGHTWTESDAPPQNWTGLASSADGTRMVAAPNNSSGLIYTSVNGGTNWNPQTIGASFSIHSVASSANGIKLVAATDSGVGPIFTSSNGGTNWVQRTNGQNWSAVCSSADGTKLAASSGGGIEPIYTSQNSGVTWTTNGPSESWSCIASSADGNELVAGVNGGDIYTSGDAGVTWTPRATTQAWSCVASSSNGMNLVAAYNTGFIFTSSDSGQTWVERTNGISSFAQSWTAIGSSADGSRLLAAVSTGLLYNSVAATTVGTTGFLTGNQYAVLALQYVGNGQWIPLSFIGAFTGN